MCHRIKVGYVVLKPKLDCLVNTPYRTTKNNDKDQQPLIVWYSTCNDMKITPEDPVFWNEDALRCLLLIRSPCLQDLKEESCYDCRVGIVMYFRNALEFYLFIF